jgi:glycosyltransferase involved in cell wall biosynthesis
LIRSGIGAEEPPSVDRAAVRAGFGWPPDASLVVFAGRLAPQKGVDDLIAAIDLVQYLLPALRVLIVGDGPLRPQLEATAAAFRLGGIVRFTGHRDDVPQLLAAADLLVLPSLYEGLPNIVLEAMQLSLPVVATAAPGTTEVVAARPGCSSRSATPPHSRRRSGPSWRIPRVPASGAPPAEPASSPNSASQP